MFMSIDAERAFAKAHYPFMKKSQQTRDRRELYKFTANSILKLCFETISTLQNLQI